METKSGRQSGIDTTSAKSRFVNNRNLNIPPNALLFFPHREQPFIPTCQVPSSGLLLLPLFFLSGTPLFIVLILIFSAFSNTKAASQKGTSAKRLYAQENAFFKNIREAAISRSSIASSACPLKSRQTLISVPTFPPSRTNGSITTPLS